MNVFIAPVPHEIGKFRGVLRAFPGIWNGAVVDVGCRSGLLGRLLPPGGSYVGLDLGLPAGVVASVEAGLPFDDGSFDTAVALDVLEHTDNIHRSLQELCRVARQHVVVSLPNIYEVRGRLRFLLGRPTSGKYTLPLEPVQDRHRWVLSLNEASRFCTSWGHQCGFRVVDEGCLVGPRHGSMLGKPLIAAFPNLLAPTYLALLARVKPCTPQRATGAVTRLHP